MKLKVVNQDGKDRVTHLLCCARAYTRYGRPIPSSIVDELCRLHECWQEGDDIPTAIVEARKTWLRARESKQLAAKLQGEA